MLVHVNIYMEVGINRRLLKI